MEELMTSVPVVALYAVLYGLTMKIADLLNEHGLRWFGGSELVFGSFWGLAGALLVLSDNALANIILAMNVAFIIRNRLDYANHRLAASIVIIVFLFSSTFEPALFLAFYATFLVFGSLKDYVGDVIKTHGVLASTNELMLYYPIPALVYCSAYGNWIVLWAFLTYTIVYDITKFLYKKIGYH